MKKIIALITLATALVFFSCSNDDRSKSNCESCTSDAGNKFEICDNGDGTYTATGPGGTETLTETQLEGFSPKDFVELACALDVELEL